MHHARQGKIRPRKNHFDLPNFQIVHSEVALAWRAGVRVLEFFRRTNHLIHVSSRDSIFRPVAEINVIRFRSQHGPAGIEL